MTWLLRPLFDSLFGPQPNYSEFNADRSKVIGPIPNEQSGFCVSGARTHSTQAFLHY